MVSPIRAALTRGEKFAPVIVTADGHLVDGNTRVTAAMANKFPTFPAVILDVQFDDAKEPELRRLHTLGAGCNARHGLGIDREEIRRAVDHLSNDPNYTATRIAALIGVTDRMVQTLLAEKKARARAESLGLHVNGSVNASKLRTLGRASEYINDQPFKELFGLVEDSGMSVKEINDLISKMRKAKSDEGASAIVGGEMEARKDQIAEYKASGKSVPPPAAKLRQRLGFILGYKASPKELVEHNRKLTDDHLEAIRETIAVLGEVIKAQGA